MKKTILTLTVLVVLAPLTVLAGTVKLAENYSLRKGDTISGDLYALGGNTTVAGNVSGDLVALGTSVFVGGNEIGQDALIVADSAHVISNVKDDLRVIARKIYVGDSVGQDVAIAAGAVEILPQAIIMGDLSVVAAKVSIFGQVKGIVKIAAGEVYIDDTLKGDVTVFADKVTLGSNAVIEGVFSYSASEQAIVAEGAQIKGEILYTQINTRSKTERLLPTLWGTWVIVKFFILLISALIAHGILRNISNRFVEETTSSPGWSLLRGFLLLVAVPVAAFVGTLTFVGIPFALFAMALYGIGVMLAMVYAPIISGSFLWKVLHRESEMKIDWKTTLLGVVFVVLLGFVPYLGSILWYSIVLLSLGGIYQVLFEKFTAVR